jgi:hypothetical protein
MTAGKGQQQFTWLTDSGMGNETEKYAYESFGALNQECLLAKANSKLLYKTGPVL